MDERLKRLILPINASIKDALVVIGTQNLRLALIYEKNVFKGIITDADIRHALLKDATLDTLVEKAMNKNPICLKEGFALEEARKLSKKYDIYDFLLLNEKGELKDIIKISDINTAKKRQELVVLMAGGLGSRLYPLTKDLPKPMLEINGKPILEKIIQGFISQGFHKFCLCVNYKKEIIKEYFKDGHNLDCEISYVQEEKRLGTAGGLGLLEGLKDEQNLIIMNADILTKLDFTKLLSKLKDADMAVALRRLSYEFPFGVVNCKGSKVLDIKEKPRMDFLINAGVYAIKAKVLKGLEVKYLDMPDFINQAILKGVLVETLLVDESWLDIGSLKDYEYAKQA